MKRQEYINLLRQLYLAANSSDTEDKPEWMKGDECATHCQQYDKIVREMNLHDNWLEQDEPSIAPQEFIEAYVEAALWSSVGEDGNALDAKYGIEDFHPASMQSIVENCSDFYNDHQDLIDSNMTLAQAGHDFWLTRNYHGVGFWDRDLGAIGQDLTEASHTYGECWITEGNDGKLYI